MHTWWPTTWPSNWCRPDAADYPSPIPPPGYTFREPTISGVPPPSDPKVAVRFREFYKRIEDYRKPKTKSGAGLGETLFTWAVTGSLYSPSDYRRSYLSLDCPFCREELSSRDGTSTWCSYCDYSTPGEIYSSCSKCRAVPQCVICPSCLCMIPLTKKARITWSKPAIPYTALMKLPKEKLLAKGEHDADLLEAEVNTLKKQLELERQKTLAYVEHRLRMDESLDKLFGDKLARLAETYGEGTPEYEDGVNRAKQYIEDIRIALSDNIDDAFTSTSGRNSEVI